MDSLNLARCSSVQGLPLRLVERIETRHGLRQLSYMKELGMGNDQYILVDLDNEDAKMTPKDAVQNLEPFKS